MKPSLAPSSRVQPFSSKSRLPNKLQGNNRTRPILVSFALLLTALSIFSAKADDDRFKDVEISATKLTDSVYLLTGSGGNIGVSSGEDGLLIIDDQFAPLAGKIERALRHLHQQGGGKADARPKYVINTHYHGDHTGGNSHFGEHGTILAHHNVLKRLSDNPKTPKTALPVITYDQGIHIHFNNDTLDVIHLGAGHTDGDSVVHWQQSNVIHMGDLYFKDRFPYVDLKGGGSVMGYRDNIAKILLKIPDDIQIIPGHGEMASKAELREFKHMLDDSINWMRGQIQAGKSLEQIHAAGVPEKYKSWGWRFITEKRWIDTLYNDLSK
ncbi:MBL fold metallo-hydrolase [Shewanella maritima]|uniref:beta-lactamase n=1 Tax=Shewanella maritima TaxID=2520507 RepID=A0A411PLJ8_9GAMM|nr:MBL fold metallo-hydrolase [Shewanella maritima]QBF84426.1 MBL fold metallo-hydrolase [Shewanella maritima]